MLSEPDSAQLMVGMDVPTPVGGIYTDPGLYKSTDGGDQWFKIPHSPDLSPAAISVDRQGVIYGIKHRRMVVSKDKGATWQPRPDVPTYYCEDDYYWRRMYRIFLYSTADGKLFSGDRRPGTGMYYSADMAIAPRFSSLLPLTNVKRSSSFGR